MFRLFRSFFNIFRRKPKAPDRPNIVLGKTPEPTPNPTETPEEAATRSGTDPAENSSPTTPSEMPSERPSENSITSSRPRRPSFENLKQVLNVLRAYTVTFGRPGTPLELRAVVGAIVANLTTVDVKNSQLEAFMDEAIAAFQQVVGLSEAIRRQQAMEILPPRLEATYRALAVLLQQSARNSEAQRVLSLI